MPPSERAALRGEPSYVWRSGQERRLTMIAQAAPLQQACVLVDGCGMGAYAAQIQDRYAAHVEAMDIEAPRIAAARQHVPRALVAAAEKLPYPSDTFDVVLSNEVLEHVSDDRLSAREMVRVTKRGGRIVIFCPNRWYPFETHGHYWKGQYHFGNTPLINYLPNRWRDKLAPHVRAYTARGLRRLFADQPVQVVRHTRIFGGYDNIARRAPQLAKVIRAGLYLAEHTPLRVLGLSHFLVLEKR